MPETLAQDLKKLNDLGLSQINAEAFMIRLRTHLDNRPQDKEHPAVKTQIDRFQHALSHINEAWARAQLEVLEDTRISLNAVRTNGHEHWPRLSDSEYLKKAKYILNLNETTKGDKELYQFQMYFNMMHSDANDISLDGVSSSQTIGAITSHVRATQIFLQELWADTGGIDGNLWTKTKAAIKEYFGFDIDYSTNIPAIPVFTAKTHPKISQKEAKHIIHSHTDSPIIGNSLWNIWVTPIDAVVLASKFIWKNINHHSIEEFQTDSKIGVDGKIGKETYGELMAADIYSYISINKEISVSTIQEITNLLWYATYNGKYMTLLRLKLKLFKSIHEDEDDFSQKYGELFKIYDTKESRYQASPEWKEDLKAAKKSTDTIYKMAKEGRWGDIIKDPTLLMAGAILFLFGVIW